MRHPTVEFQSQQEIRFVEMASQMIRISLVLIVEALGHLEDDSAFADGLKLQASIIGRLYANLKQVFDQTKPLTASLTADMDRGAIQARTEELKCVASRVAHLARWVGDITDLLIEAVQSSAVDDEEGRDRNADSDERHFPEDDPNSPEDTDPYVGQDDPETAPESQRVVRSMIANVCCRMAMLAGGSRDDGEPRTVADLATAFSGSEIYAVPDPMSEQIESLDPAVVPAIALVLETMLRTREELAVFPPIPLDDLRAFLRNPSGPGVHSDVLTKMAALKDAHLPLRIVSKRGGQIECVLELPEVAMTSCMAQITTLFESLERITPLLKSQGVAGSGGSRVNRDTASLELYYSLTIPASLGRLMPVHRDSLRVARADTRQLAAMRSGELDRSLRLRVFTGELHRTIQLMIPTRALSSRADRVLLAKTLEQLVPIWDGFEATRTRVLLEAGEECSLQDAFDGGAVVEVSRGVSESATSVAEDEHIDTDFVRAHRFLRRRAISRQFARGFMDETRDVEPYIALPASVVNDDVAMRLMLSLHQTAPLRQVHLTPLRGNVGDFRRVVSKLQEEVESARAKMHDTEGLVLGVNVARARSSTDCEIHYLLYDKRYTLCAAGLIEFVGGWEVQGARRIFPRAQMDGLAQAIHKTLSDLWGTPRVTIGAAETSLIKLGFEVSDRILGTFVGSLLRRETPMSDFEVRACLGRCLMEDLDSWVIDDGSGDFQLSVLNPFEHHSRYSNRKIAPEDQGPHS